MNGGRYSKFELDIFSVVDRWIFTITVWIGGLWLVDVHKFKGFELVSNVFFFGWNVIVSASSKQQETKLPDQR